MKKTFLLGITAIAVLALTACSSSKTKEEDTKVSQSKVSQSSIAKPTLKLPKDVTVDKTGTATIEGTTLPNTDVRIGMGIIGDSTTSDEEGKFTLTYDLDEDSEDETIEVTASGDDDITKKVIVKQNPEIIKKKADEKKAEAAAKAAEAAAEAQKEADKKNPATYPTLPYDEMARNGNKHKDEKLQITGKVIQAQDTDDGGAMLRVATSADGYDDIYMVQVNSDEWQNHRLLEDDVITIYGDVFGLYSYESTLGGKITVPALIAVFY